MEAALVSLPAVTSTAEVDGMEEAGGKTGRREMPLVTPLVVVPLRWTLNPLLWLQEAASKGCVRGNDSKTSHPPKQRSRTRVLVALLTSKTQMCYKPL